MIALDASLDLNVHIVISIAIMFSFITGLFLACTAVIRIAGIGAKQAGDIRNKIIKFRIKMMGLRQTKSLSTKKPKKIFKIKLGFRSRKSIDLAEDSICWTDELL